MLTNQQYFHNCSVLLSNINRSKNSTSGFNIQCMRILSVCQMLKCECASMNCIIACVTLVTFCKNHIVVIRTSETQ